MSTLKFNSLNEIYQALTDFEIEDDRKKDGVPLAVVRIKRLHRILWFLNKIKITQCSEFGYFEYLNPMRDKILNYYGNKLLLESGEEDDKKILAKIKNFANELSNINNTEELKRKAATMAYLFEDKEIRYYFFKMLKKLRLIKWWIRWRHWQRTVKPHHTLALFTLLWGFNFDGFKKKTEKLLKTLNTIFQNTNFQSPIESINSMDFESFKKAHQTAHERLKRLSNNSKN